MKRVFLYLTGLVFVSIAFYSCLNKHEGRDKVKRVEMTIYPETGYGMSVLSQYWTDVLIYSDSDENQKQALVDIMTEGFDFEYEMGYKYTFKANKVWMSDPPMDVSSIKYIFAGAFKKSRVIIVDSEEILELSVSPETVEYIPKYPVEYENERYKIYNALLCKETSSNKMYVLKGIEGFDFESGYEYILSVKKIIHAQPYSVRYVLVDVKKCVKID